MTEKIKTPILILLTAVLSAVISVLPVIGQGESHAYSNSTTIRPGHWELTGETFFTPVHELRQDGDLMITAKRGSDRNADDMVFEFSEASAKRKDRKTIYTVHTNEIQNSYPAGGKCKVDFTITRSAADPKHPLGNVYGSLYFADITEGDDAFGQEITVREFFARQRTKAYGPTILRHFGIGKDEGRDGSSAEKDGTDDFYYHPVCDLPRLTADGDKIWLVLEIMDGGEGLSLMRNVWEFSWIPEPEKELPEPPEEETHDPDDPEWLSFTYTGHWDLTDIRYIGTGAETETDGDISVLSERIGVDGQDIMYTYCIHGEDGKSCSGEKLAFTIPELPFDIRYYAGDTFHPEIEIFADADAKNIPGSVICSLAFADVDFASGEYGVKVTPRKWFRVGYNGQEVKTFGPMPHGETMSWRNDIQRSFLYVEGSFPEGVEDGEKIWLVFGVMDSGSGENRLYNIYEYTWTRGPDTVWLYNMPRWD